MRSALQVAVATWQEVTRIHPGSGVTCPEADRTDSGKCKSILRGSRGTKDVNLDFQIVWCTSPADRDECGTQCTLAAAWQREKTLWKPLACQYTSAVASIDALLRKINKIKSNRNQNLESKKNHHSRLAALQAAGNCKAGLLT